MAVSIPLFNNSWRFSGDFKKFFKEFKTFIHFDEVNSFFISEKRHDRTTRIGAQLMAPISAQWSFVANIDYRKNRSNVDGSFGYDFNCDGWSTLKRFVIMLD
mgnify:CR=1 FL=1